MTPEEVVQHLGGGKSDGNGGWMVRCPAHEDRRPSLHVSRGNEQVLLKCFADCATEKILWAASLEMKDLFFGSRAPANDSRFAPTSRSREVVARYEYHDAWGELVARKVRYKPKSFRWERLDAGGAWVSNLNGTALPLYHLPSVLQAKRERAPIYLAAGEKDTDALIAAGVVATTNPHGEGPTKWRPDFTETLAGSSEIVIVRHRDPKGEEHAEAQRAELDGRVGRVRIVEAKEGNDAHDHLAAGHGLDEFVPVQLPVGQAPPPEAPSTNEETPLAEILDDVYAYDRDYIVTGEHEAVTVTLWAAHTHVHDAFDVSPYLAVISPEPRCGKSRQLTVLGFIVKDKWHIVRPTEAVIFRKIARDHPTMLLDECDAIWSAGSRDESREALRSILDAGNEKGVSVPRCVGPQLDLVDFPTYCPKALAGKRALPETIHDRAITIRAKRKTKSEKVERLKRRQVEPRAAKLKTALEAWAIEAHDVLQDARPELPDALDDRAQDAWEPLLAIADLAGGDWPRRARAAALALSADEDYEDDSAGVRLLVAMRGVFGDNDRIFSATALALLHADEEAPWMSWGKNGKPITATQVGRLLKSYGIRSRSIRNGDETAKGYRTRAV